MSKFSADLARYKGEDGGWKHVWMNPAVWAIASYRLGNWLHTNKPFVLIRIPLKVVSVAANMFCEVFMEMCIDTAATIGEGLYIGHIGGVHINPGAVLGKNCNLAHRVTIGTSGMGRKGAPIIGDEVYIGTGAALIGKIKVGSRAKIAANTLVMSNVPEGATVMGVPGQVMMQPAKAAPTPAQVAAGARDAD